MTSRPCSTRKWSPVEGSTRRHTYGQVGIRRSSERCALIAFTGFLLATTAVKALDLSGTEWDRAAATADIDPLMLYAVALTESGRASPGGGIAPWPWTLNVAGRAHFAETREAAATLLAEHPGKSVDVGLLQVNTHWHGHRIADIEALLDPAVNLEIGAAILEEAIESAPGDLSTGIGRYHSSRPEHAEPYARAVLSFYRFLLHDEAGP